MTLDFARLHRLRKGYGYSNLQDATNYKKLPDMTCIWRINIESGEIVPLLKYTDFYSFETRPEMKGAEHKINHIMLCPNENAFWFSIVGSKRNGNSRVLSLVI